MEIGDRKANYKSRGIWIIVINNGFMFFYLLLEQKVF